MPAPYRVGIIGRTGRGNYGHGLDTVWLDVPRTRIVAVADDQPAGLASALTRTGASQGYADYREMLDKERLDIVAVAPRWIDQHAELVLAALEHGCHVYMEKPFCRSLEEADRIVNAAEMRHLQLAIAHQTRWSPLLTTVLREISAGAIGRVLELRGRGKEDPRRGGGEDLWVLGSHILDLMRAVSGDPLTCSATVLSAGHPATQQDVVDGPEGLGPIAGDQINATYQFKDGITGYFGSHRGAGRTVSRFGLQIYGTDGVIEVLTGHLSPCFILQDGGWSPGRSGKTWVPLTTNGVGKPETLSDGGLHAGNVLAVNDLLDCIENPMRRPKCNVYDARWTVEMILGIYAAHRAGQPVALPLADRRHPLA
jgi:predicted dehydrogenase